MHLIYQRNKKERKIKKTKKTRMMVGNQLKNLPNKRKLMTTMMGGKLKAIELKVK